METTSFLDAIESISIQAEADLQRQVALYDHLTKRLKEEFGYEYIHGIRYGRNVQAFLEMEEDKFKSK